MEECYKSIAGRYNNLNDATRLGAISLPEAISQYAWVTKEGKLSISHLGSAVIEQIDDKDYSIPFIITTFQEDRDGDLVYPGGAYLDDYAKNPVVFWGHQQAPVPIATSRSPDGRLCIFPSQKDIKAIGFFDKHDQDAMFIYGKIKRGFLNATSVAFVPIEAYRREYREKAQTHHGRQLLPPGWEFVKYNVTEWSIVGVPSNAGAVRDWLDTEKSFITPRLQKSLDYYAAIPKQSWNGWAPTCPAGFCEKNGICVPIEKRLGSYQEQLDNAAICESQGKPSGMSALGIGTCGDHEPGEITEEAVNGDGGLLREDSPDMVQNCIGQPGGMGGGSADNGGSSLRHTEAGKAFPEAPAEDGGIQEATGNVEGEGEEAEHACDCLDCQEGKSCPCGSVAKVQNLKRKRIVKKSANQQIVEFYNSVAHISDEDYKRKLEDVKSQLRRMSRQDIQDTWLAMGFGTSGATGPKILQYISNRRGSWERAQFNLDNQTTKYITHSGSQWVVHAESGKVLGKHDTRESAVRQLQAIEANKHKSVNKSTPSPEEHAQELIRDTGSIDAALREVNRVVSRLTSSGSAASLWDHTKRILENMKQSNKKSVIKTVGEEAKIKVESVSIGGTTYYTAVLLTNGGRSRVWEGHKQDTKQEAMQEAKEYAREWGYIVKELGVGKDLQGGVQADIETSKQTPIRSTVSQSVQDWLKRFWAAIGSAKDRFQDIDQSWLYQEYRSNVDPTKLAYSLLSKSIRRRVIKAIPVRYDPVLNPIKVGDIVIARQILMDEHNEVLANPGDKLVVMGKDGPLWIVWRAGRRGKAGTPKLRKSATSIDKGLVSGNDLLDAFTRVNNHKERYWSVLDELSHKYGNQNRQQIAQELQRVGVKIPAMGGSRSVMADEERQVVKRKRLVRKYSDRVIQDTNLLSKDPRFTSWASGKSSSNEQDIQEGIKRFGKNRTVTYEALRSIGKSITKGDKSEKSRGHIGFSGDFEYYVDGSGSLFRAKISQDVFPDGYRQGRWECGPEQVESRLRQLGLNK